MPASEVGRQLRDVEGGELVKTLGAEDLGEVRAERLALKVTSAIGPPGPASVGGGGGAEVVNDQSTAAIGLPAGSCAPLTAAV